MDRRDFLKSAASAAAGGGVMAAGSLAVLPAGDKTPAARSSSGPTPRLTASDGVALFHRDWGVGNPVVFIAPWGLHSDWWEYQTAHLSGNGLRCISYDRRGHGRSSEPTGGYDFDTLADDLAVVLERLDLRGVTLVGQSLGCGEIVRYLSRHGTDRIARLAMIAPITPFLLKTPANPAGIDASIFEKAREAVSRDRPHLIAQAAPGFFGAPPNPVSAEIVQWWTEMMMQCSMKVLIELHRVFTVTDFSAELKKIVLPALIIHGDKDVSTPIDLTAKKTAELLRGSELRIYENAAHGLPITHMGRLNSDLVAFAKS